MYYERVVDEKSYYLFFHAEYNENTEPHFTPPHCHDAYELLIVKKGAVEGVINGEPATVSAGEMVFLDSYDIHSFTFTDCERYSLVFSKDHCRMLSGDSLTLPTRPALKPEKFSRITDLLTSIIPPTVSIFRPLFLSRAWFLSFSELSSCQSER